MLIDMTLGVDIGGTKTLLAVFNGNSIIAEEKFPTSEDYPEFLKKLTDYTSHYIERYEVTNVGIAAPGKVDKQGNLVKGGNLKWQNVPIKQDVEKATGLKVTIDNDANVGAVGEANIGAGQGYDKVLYITISTGIGIGVTVGGKISPALETSEAGHMSVEKDGQMVVWEKVASGSAFFNTYKQQGVQCNDPAIWQEYVKDIALGLNPIIATVDPSVIIVGGSMGEHLHKYHDFLVEELEKYHDEMIDIPPIIAAKHPDHAVIYGCNIIADNS